MHFQIGKLESNSLFCGRSGTWKLVAIEPLPPEKPRSPGLLSAMGGRISTSNPEAQKVMVLEAKQITLNRLCHVLAGRHAALHRCHKSRFAQRLSERIEILGEPTVRMITISIVGDDLRICKGATGTPTDTSGSERCKTRQLAPVYHICVLRRPDGPGHTLVQDIFSDANCG